MDKKWSFGLVCFRVMLLCILNVCSGGFNFFVHSLKFSSRVTKCFVSPAELMCSTDPHPPTLKFRNKNGSNKTRLFLVYLSFQISPKSNDAICDFRFWFPLDFVNQHFSNWKMHLKKNWVLLKIDCDFSVTPIFVFIQRLILSLELERKLPSSAKPNYLSQIIGQKLPNLDTFASLTSLKLITWASITVLKW